MEFLHIYLLIAATIASVTAIFVTKILNTETVLQGNGSTFIQKYISKLQHDLERSHTGITVQQYVVLMLGCPASLAVLAYFVSDDRTLMLILMLLGMMMPNMLIRLKKNSENKKFENWYVMALSQMASSLHAGLTVEQAVDYVVSCELLHASIREDFRILSSQLKLGIPISEAFFNFAKMTENKDAFDVATAITIMTEVGGDAGSAIEKLQKNIEDRLLYRKKRESMMTESNIIAIFADVIPIVILVGTYFLMPGTIEVYFQDPIMTVIFFVIIGILLFGSVVVHRMLNNKMDL